MGLATVLQCDAAIAISMRLSLTAAFDTQVDGQTTDHASYLVPKGTADIFFPTDFRLLQHLHHLAHQGKLVLMSACPWYFHISECHAVTVGLL